MPTPQTIITYSADGSNKYGPSVVKEPDGRTNYGFSPYFEAKRGSHLIFRGAVRLGSDAARFAVQRILDAPEKDIPTTDILNKLLMRYGVRQIEAAVRELHQAGSQPEEEVVFWRIGTNDLDELFALWSGASDKACAYQRRTGRDLFCISPSPGDTTAGYSVDQRPAAPTSRSLCNRCDLPDADVLCSNLLHPQVGSTAADQGGVVRRRVEHAICDIGSAELRGGGGVAKCRPDGHACWERHVDVELPTVEPISPLELPEQFDVLDSEWRLLFGPSKRLLKLATVHSTASLAMDCASRGDFEQRLTALADIIDKLTVAESLLSHLSEEDRKAKIRGSLDAMEQALLAKLPEKHHTRVSKAIKTLRSVHQIRNGMQHGTNGEQGMIAKLQHLNIRDVPPNWRGAWNQEPYS